MRHYDRRDAVRDKDVITKRIAELRAEKMSFKEIGMQLTKDNLMPAAGSKWYAQTVADIWNRSATSDQEKAIEVAVGLHKANYSLRKIGAELTLRGITPPKGGVWHAAQVEKLLILAKIKAA